METEDKKTRSLYNSKMPSNVRTFDEDNYVESPSRRVTEAPAFPTPFLASPEAVHATFLTTGSKQPYSNEPCSKWNIQTPPVLPNLHPLEPTSVFVEQTDSSIIGDRIGSTLKERSIQSEYFGNEARCLSVDNVEFSVFIYRGRGPKFSHGIIVEVQRLFGISFNYFKDVRAILGAAEVNNFVCEKDTFDRDSCLIDKEQTGRDNVSLDFVIKMLNTHGCERLGLQLLIALTDAFKMGRKNAQKAADLMIANGIGLKIIDYLKIDELKPMCFIVLRNILYHQSTNVSLAAALSPILFSTIEDAPSAPQLAFLAAKCLEPLLLNHGVTRSTDFERVLDTAAYIGGVRHKGLELQARRCLLHMGLGP